MQRFSIPQSLTRPMSQSQPRSVLPQRIIALLLIAAVCLAGLPQMVMAQTNDGPSFWLKFDEAGGATTFADAGGGNRNATCVGGACPTAGVPGRLGQAAQFDGTDDRIGAAVNAPAGAYTLAAWVNGADWNDWRTIFEFGDDAPWFGVATDGSLNLYPIISGGAVPVGQWAHVAYVWTGTENRLYVNGAAVATNQTAPPANGQGVVMGLETNGFSPWVGLLDEARVYERALTAGQIQELARPEEGPVAPPPPVNPVPQPPTPPIVDPNPQPDNVKLIDMTISLYKPVTDAAERARYEALFSLFADSLYEVSNGLHKVRNVTFYDSGRFSDRADIRWIQFEAQPRASTNAYGKGRGTVFMGDAIFDQQTAITDETKWPVFVATFAHEWGHYFYGMLDEYAGSQTGGGIGSPQQGDTPPTPCSVMCAAGATFTFDTYNFSTPKSTAQAGRTNTAHYRSYGASGWETIIRTPANDPQALRGSRLYWPELAQAAPAAGQDPTVELPANRDQARNALKFNWVDANAATNKHRVFLVDVTADMGTNNKLESAKASLKNYIDRTSVGDQIGIISFADTHAVVQPITRIEGDATKAAIKAQIDTLQPKAGINDRRIATADQLAREALQQVATNAFIIDRGVYVIIDGTYTDQTDPHIFQKMYNDHSGAGIPASVFNFSANGKPNDLWSNSMDLLRWSSTSTGGAYQTVGAGGIAIPARVTAAEADPVEGSTLYKALDTADQAFSASVDVDLGTDYGLSIEVDETLSVPVYVDATLDGLEIAVFYDDEIDAADTYLYDPDGFAVDAPVCEYDGVESLCYFGVEDPLDGEWTLEISAVTTPITAEYWATGYNVEGGTYVADLRSLAGDVVTTPEQVVLQASLRREDAIAGATASAWVENPYGDYTDFQLRDDGVAPDQLADDGLYTALMPYDLPGAYYATVVFDNIDGEAVFTQKGMADVTDPNTRPVPDDFDRFAHVEIWVDGDGSDDHGDDNENATEILADNGDVAGRIDTPGDTDTFRAYSPVSIVGDPKGDGLSIAAAAKGATEGFIVRLTNFSGDMNAVVEVITDAGSDEYATGVLGYGDFWTKPIVLSAGESAYVKVRHANGDAVGGSYSLSLGTPLPDEEMPAGDAERLFLPMTMR